MRALMLLPLCASLIGCQMWPDKGHGGFAEHRIKEHIPVVPDEPLTPEHGLRFDLELLQRHLDVLVLEGAELCFPSTVALAKTREQRIARALYGGLSDDAAVDIVIQREQLRKLEARFDVVQAGGACQREQHAGMPTHATPNANTRESLEALFNSDNQFAIDSEALNPKYLQRLQQGSKILKQQPDWRLHIIGHASKTGTDAYNQTLSLRRAQRVAGYLNAQGVSMQRIEVTAQGVSQPYSTESGPEHRLVNRRVTVHVLNGDES